MLALDLHFEIMLLNCMKIHVFGVKKGWGVNTRMFLLYFHVAKQGIAPTDFSEMKLYLYGSVLSLNKFVIKCYAKFGILSAKSVSFSIPYWWYFFWIQNSSKFKSGSLKPNIVIISVIIIHHPPETSNINICLLMNCLDESQIYQTRRGILL